MSNDPDENVNEDELPATGVDPDNPKLLVPQRIQLNFLGAHRNIEYIEDAMDALVKEGERLGLIFSYGGYIRMPFEDVIPGSPLEQIITGRPPRTV